MPLKPIFEKAPLTAMTCQPLRAGMVRSDDAALRKLYELCGQQLSCAMLEGAFRLACIVTAKPDEEPVTTRIRAALASQKEDGSFDVPVMDAVAILRAGWALYEYEARKPLLEPASRWCAWAVRNWDALLEEDDLWANPADLLELLENLYRVTGKAAFLNLCERLSAQTMAWSTVLNTISVQRPTNRSVTVEELANGLYGGADREGYYPRFYRTSHAESLADGARASMARGWYSGSATELNAARNGWERLQRHHGAICGGLTADELIEGTSPASLVSTAAVGAWTEALSVAAMGEDAEWAWNALERLSVNAIPAAMKDGFHAFQRVNNLAGDTTDAFMVNDDHDERALNRLVRGVAAAASCAVTASVNGLAVNLYLPGRYAVPVGDQLLLVNLQRTKNGASLMIHCKQETKAVMRLRLPEWSRSVEVAVNGAESDAGRECRAGVMTIDRKWHDGDVVTVVLEETLRVLEGHHQGRYVMKGAVLMALPVAAESWARSFVNAVEENGCIYAVTDMVKDWRLNNNGDMADIPVLPAASDCPVERCAMAPYAETDARIALFPRRKD